jgi:hypothetical protein
LYVILVQPGMLVTMHTSFWSLDSCNEARGQALSKHHDIQVAICVPEDDAIDTWNESIEARSKHARVIEGEIEEVEVELVE